jgi:hypothetical protein
MWMIVIPPAGAARAVGHHIAHAFASLGLAHETFDMGTTLRAMRGLLRLPDEQMATDLANQHLIVRTLDRPCTHLLVLALAPVTLFTLTLLRKHGVRTLHWFYEDFRRARYWRDVLDGYDCFAAVQRAPLEQACRERGVRFALVNTAAALAGARPSGTPRYDIAFVGIPSAYRVAMLTHLARNGFRLAIGGHGWKHYAGPLRRFVLYDDWMADEVVRGLLQAARIGVNLSVNSPREGEGYAQLSPRAFDILAAGALLLTEDVPLTHEALTGCAYATFADEHQMLTEARRLCDSFESLYPRRTANQRVVREKHTYLQRVRTLVEFGDDDTPRR